MKLQLLIVSVLKYLVLTNQEEETQLPMSDGTFFDENVFSDFNNSTYVYEDKPQDDMTTDDVCSLTVPGFNSIGLLIAYSIVFVFSMVGNSVVVYVVCSMKMGRTTTDIYLMHLAMADLLFSLTLPFWAIDAHSGWIFGNFLCKLLSGFQEASVYSGVFLLASISVDRHFAIVRATRVMSSHHMLVKMVCGVSWLVAGLLSLPVVIQKESSYDGSLGQSFCYENLTGESSQHWRFGLRVLRHTVGFFLPLAVMAVCYGWTLVTLFHTRNQQKHKAIRVILSVVLAFVVCWLPYNIAVLVDTVIHSQSPVTCETIYRVEMMLNVTQVLAYMHCAVNPVLYAFIGQKFRNQLLVALYRHGVISKRLHMAFRKGSVNSVASTKSRNTSATM